MGLMLLACVLVSAYVRIRRQLVMGVPDVAIRLVLLAMALVYNYSEASFNKIGVLWFMTVFAVLEYRSHARAAVREPRAVTAGALP
jgi:hypothetical protein